LAVVVDPPAAGAAAAPAAVDAPPVAGAEVAPTAGNAAPGRLHDPPFPEREQSKAVSPLLNVVVSPRPFSAAKPFDTVLALVAGTDRVRERSGERADRLDETRAAARALADLELEVDRIREAAPARGVVRPFAMAARVRR